MIEYKHLQNTFWQGFQSLFTYFVNSPSTNFSTFIGLLSNVAKQDALYEKCLVKTFEFFAFVASFSAITLGVMCICTCLRVWVCRSTFQLFPLCHLESFYHPVFHRIRGIFFECIMETSTYKFSFFYMEPSWNHYENIVSYIYRKILKLTMPQFIFLV